MLVVGLWGFAFSVIVSKRSDGFQIRVMLLCMSSDPVGKGEGGAL